MIQKATGKGEPRNPAVAGEPKAKPKPKTKAKGKGKGAPKTGPPAGDTGSTLYAEDGVVVLTGKKGVCFFFQKEHEVQMGSSVLRQTVSVLLPSTPKFRLFLPLSVVQRKYCPVADLYRLGLR